MREEEEYFTAAVVTGDTWCDLAMSSAKHAFTCDFSASKSCDDLPPSVADDVQVLAKLVHVGGKTVWCNVDPVPLRTYLDLLPRVESVERPGPAPRRASGGDGDPQESLVRQYPWLQDYWDTSQATTPQDSSDDVGDHVEIDDACVEHAFEELERRRAEWAEAPEERFEDFGVRLLGGEWTARERGVACDAFQAYARGALATAFCAGRGLAKTSRFEIALSVRPMQPSLREAGHIRCSGTTHATSRAAESTMCSQPQSWPCIASQQSLCAWRLLCMTQPRRGGGWLRYGPFSPCKCNTYECSVLMWAC
jgi:hypothetical protein